MSGRKTTPLHWCFAQFRSVLALWYVRVYLCSFLDRKHKASGKKSGWKIGHRQRDGHTHQQKDGQIRRQIGEARWERLADGVMCLCVCLYAPAELRLSSSTEAKLNGEGRLKAVPGPAASVFNHRSPQHFSLHADQAAVKGAMHFATPIHKCTDYTLVRSWYQIFTGQKWSD